MLTECYADVVQRTNLHVKNGGSINVKEKTIHGVFEYNDKQYPFSLDGRILTIPQIPFQYKDDFNEVAHIDTLYGVTNGNQGIVFLGCEVLKSSTFHIPISVSFLILGYILLQSSDTSFDRIDFYSAAINGFYTPRKAYDFETSNDPMEIKGIKIRDREQYKKAFDCEVKGETFELGVDVYVEINLAFEKERLGTARSIISMAFGDKKSPDRILDYFLYVRDFLEFVNFRKDVPVEQVRLFRKKGDGKHERIGEAVVFQADCSSYSHTAMKSITLDDMTPECFPLLFQQIAEKRTKGTYNPFFYPANRREDNFVDAARWLNTAICFEGEFNAVFPDYRAKNDQLFYEAKSLLLDTISAEIEKSGKGINNKVNSALKSFKSLVDNADTTIKQKFEVCQTTYAAETAETITRECNAYGIHEDADLAEAYALYRNDTAHGTLKRPEPIDVVTYSILRYFVYAMNLKKANIPPERIADIIRKVF